MLKVIELFGGIGACTQALKRIGIDFKVVDYVEIDKYAVASYNAMNNTNFETQDICEWDKDIEADLIMHGSPCQDFSIAGKQAGGDEGTGTRSSLMYETIRIVNKIKPKYVIWENVKNLLSKKHKHNFDKYIEILNEGGYNSYYQVLNAKDYGIPQNRERVYTISIRKDIDNGSFKFPEKQELKLKLKDMLEEEVDEKYYLSDKMLNYISADNNKWTENNKESIINKTIASTINTGEGQRRCDASNYISNIASENYNLKQQLCDYLVQNNLVKENDVINHSYSKNRIENWNKRNVESNNFSPTITSRSDTLGIAVRNATKGGYAVATNGDSVNLAYPNSKTRRGRVGKEVSQTLQCTDNMGVVVNRTICLNSKAGRNGIDGLQPSRKDRIYDSNGIATTVATSDFYNPSYLVKENIVKENKCNDSMRVTVIGNYMPSNHEASRIVDNEGLAPTVKENHGTVTAIVENKTIEQLEHKEMLEDNIETLENEISYRNGTKDSNLRIRKLTPKECWRLMGFNDEEFEKAEKVNSNAQLYKQAGNSIVVDVLEKIFRNLLEGE